MSQGKELMFRKMADGKKIGYTHISFSEFSLFKQCGHKHLIQKYLGIDQEPPSIHLYFGNAIHESIEKTFDNQFSTESRVKYFKDTFVKDMKENMSDTPEINEMNDFVAQGENILRTLDIEQLIAKYEIISVEEPLYEKVYGRFFFKGFIDLVARDRKTGRIVIIDWKTASEPWNMFWKMKDKTFLMQMKLYKYFWARKNNVDLSQIDTKYIVLSRLRNKKKPDEGFGPIEDVEMSSTMGEIRNALEELAIVFQKVHILNEFPKAKYIIDNEGNPIEDIDGLLMIDDKPCKFCKYKGGKHALCNNSPKQGKTLLQEYLK